ncbi:MAG: ComEC family competence protein [Firmicutes bacterium ADurb.Bin300]|nr:MAG: ComEC family competence protein [Firmicutes bacterium ADurb.Bin300]
MVKKIATWIIVPLMILIFILDIISVAYANHLEKNYSVCAETFDYSMGDDRIHFLNTGCSDAILIESNGKFALIDSGEGYYNPRRKIEYTGYTKLVLDYLKKVASDENGKVQLDFILGTHCHYDHIGAFPDIIRFDNIEITKAYLKEYNYDLVRKYESGFWDNDKTYREVLDALDDKGVPVIRDLPQTPFAFGDFIITFYNTETPKELLGNGENAASVGIKIIKGQKSVFLAADITRTCKLEQIIGPLVGDIDLLKIGHHGYYGSSSMSFLSELKPEIAIVTNHTGKIYPNVKWNLTMYSKTPVYSTVNYNGIIASFPDSGDIVLTNNIH